MKLARTQEGDLSNWGTTDQIFGEALYVIRIVAGGYIFARDMGNIGLKTAQRHENETHHESYKKDLEEGS